MHITQYWSAVQGMDDHEELTILALMAFEDDNISEEQSFELGDHIKKQRDKLKTQGIFFNF